MTAKTNGSLQTSQRFDKLVRHYIDVRKRIDQITNRYKEQVAPFEEMKEKLSAALLKILDESGAEMVRTTQGTVSSRVKHTATCSDPDAFIEYVRANDLYELLDRRPNSTACREYAVEHAGELPPGVKLNSIRYVGVRS